MVPSPTEHGWTDDEGKLAIHWMRCAPAPDVVLELLACKCVRSCSMPSCTRLSSGLTCTDMCRLQNCSNQHVQDDEAEAVLELGESDDEQFDE